METLEQGNKMLVTFERRVSDPDKREVRARPAIRIKVGSEAAPRYVYLSRLQAMRLVSRLMVSIEEWNEFDR